MRPFPGEPPAGPWAARPLVDVCRDLIGLAASRATRRAPVIIAVDGRSAAGKSTVAQRMAEVVAGCAVVHTDDIAWHHSFFGWTDLLRAGVLEPVRRGDAVAYRPPAWNERGRSGAIEVPAGCRAVLVEGVGAGRRELAPVVDALVWVQSDAAGARTRGIARDGGDVAFWDEWEAEEVPFLALHRPWERADLIIAGSPVLDHDPDHEMVVARLGAGEDGNTREALTDKGADMDDDKPRNDEPEDQPEVPGAEGGSGGSADVPPAAPSDDDTALGDTDQHSDAQA